MDFNETYHRHLPHRNLVNLAATDLSNSSRSFSPGIHAWLSKQRIASRHSTSGFSLQ